MMEKTNGLSRDLIIHPGETLRELLNDRGITSKELAEKIGVSENQVTKIMNGLACISCKFAKKLEHMFGISSSFWLNLQENYDNELEDFKRENQIDDAIDI